MNINAIKILLGNHNIQYDWLVFKNDEYSAVELLKDDFRIECIEYGRFKLEVKYFSGSSEIFEAAPENYPNYFFIVYHGSTPYTVFHKNASIEILESLRQLMNEIIAGKGFLKNLEEIFSYV